jgi:hypothetical protein
MALGHLQPTQTISGLNRQSAGSLFSFVSHPRPFGRGFAFVSWWYRYFTTLAPSCAARQVTDGF